MTYPSLPACYSSFQSQTHIACTSFSSLSVSLFTYTIGGGTGSGVALGKEVWRAWLSWDCNLILWHSDFIKGVIRLMVFIWMANGLFHCLRIWKLISRGQRKAAGLAWVLSCGFESVVSMSQGTLRDSESCSLPETRKGQSNWRFPGGLSFAWHDLEVKPR